MISAIQNAFAGIQTASKQFEGAAKDIVNSSTQNNAITSPASSQPTGELPTNNSPVAGLESVLGNQGADLTSSIVSLKEAELSYKASAKVLGALNDTQKEVLETLA